jgi:ankyrin repeat protein
MDAFTKTAGLGACLLLAVGAPARTEGEEQTQPKPTMGFHAAARDGDIQELRANLFWSQDVNERDGPLKMTPLHRCLANRHVGASRVLIEGGADIQATDRDDRTPLHYAADAGVPAIAELLLDKGADINARTKDGSTPLHLTAKKGRMDHVAVAVSLIERGADVNVTDSKGQTPLHVAAIMGCSEIAARLIAHGADVNAKDNNGWTPLRWAVDQQESWTLIDLLREHGGVE